MKFKFIYRTEREQVGDLIEESGIGSNMMIENESVLTDQDETD